MLRAQPGQQLAKFRHRRFAPPHSPPAPAGCAYIPAPRPIPFRSRSPRTVRWSFPRATPETDRSPPRPMAARRSPAHRSRCWIHASSWRKQILQSPGFTAQLRRPRRSGNALHHPDRIDRIGNRLSIGTDQSTRAQQRSPEIAGHDGEVSVEPRVSSTCSIGAPAVPLGSPSSLERRWSPRGPMIHALQLWMASQHCFFSAPSLSRASSSELTRSTVQMKRDFFDDQLDRAVMGNGAIPLGHTRTVAARAGPSAAFVATTGHPGLRPRRRRGRSSYHQDRQYRPDDAQPHDRSDP